jgi:hypothetical protein
MNANFRKEWQVKKKTQDNLGYFQNQWKLNKFPSKF